MGKRVLRECFIEVDGVDLSDHVEQVTVHQEKEQVESTNFGGSGKEYVHGLSEDTFTLTFHQNFDTASVDDTLYPLYSDEEEFTTRVRPSSDDVGASNPEYSSARCKLFSYDGLDGTVGELSKIEVEIPAMGDGIARATEAPAG